MLVGPASTPAGSANFVFVRWSAAARSFILATKAAIGAGIPAGERLGDVVAGWDEQGLEGLELGQLLTRPHPTTDCLLGGVGLVGGDVLVGDGDRRARSRPPRAACR